MTCLVQPRLQVGRWRNKVCFLPRLDVAEVEPLPLVDKAAAGSVVRARRLLGTVESPEPDVLDAGHELRRPGAVREPADATEVGGADWLATAARRHGFSGESGAARLKRRGCVAGEGAKT
jgi:hypothetical protein